MPYRIADAFNNAAGLADLNPQPASYGLDGRSVSAISGAVYVDATFVVFRYAKLLPAADFASLLTQTGLSFTVRYNEVTVAVNAGGNRETFSNWNAIIQLPRYPRYEKGFYRDVEFLVQLLEAL